MIDRPRWRDRLQHYASVPIAIALFAASMVVASTFRDPGSNGAGPPGPGQTDEAGPAGQVETQVPWAGPSLYGIFAGCNPACDLEIAVEGIGRRLTMTDRATDESAPSLSPDRASVVYRCAEPAIEPGGEATPRPEGPGSLCLVDTIDPEDQEATFPAVTTVLTDPTLDYGGPAWSPDGTTIAFVARDATGTSRLGLYDVASGQARDIPMDPVDPGSPAWSADGERIAFACGSGTVAQPSTRFCIMPSEGGDITALGEVGGDCGVPAFMPDGVHLGVVCVVPGAEGGDLFMLAVDEPFTHSFTTSQQIAPEGIKRVVFDPDQHYAFVRREDALWALGIPEGAWSQPPLPPLHGDFDLQVLEAE